MTAELNDDEYGHDLTLYGMVHRVDFSKTGGKGVNNIFVYPQYSPNGFNLYQEDINALYKYLEQYVTE